MLALAFWRHVKVDVIPPNLKNITSLVNSHGNAPPPIVPSNTTNEVEMQEIIHAPARIATIATSKPAQRTYLNTLLLILASTFLLFTSILAYGSFYWNYIPRIGIEKVVHLQYGGSNPIGLIDLQRELVSQQQYDISLTLHVPRSPRNLERGNFMVAVNLLRDSYTPPSFPTQQRSAPLLSALTGTEHDAITNINKEDLITTLRRTTLLTYTSRLVSLSSRILTLPLYILSLRSESETLTIPLADLLSFEGRTRFNVPSYALVEIEAGQQLQIYSATLSFIARFGGLRWWMYNHRVISAIIGISTFWIAEVIFTLLTWVVINSIFAKPSKTTSKLEEPEIKTEEEDTPPLSPTERTFPTYGRNKKPLKWESTSPPQIKQEEEILEDVQIQPLDADDEDDDEAMEGFRDSGLGTSYSDAGRGGGSMGGRRRKKGVGRVGNGDE